jgi:excisionase family DNA binding protein
MTKGEGGGLANSAAQLGAGLAMGQQIAQGMNAPQSTPLAAPPPLPGTGLPESLSPAETARALGVSESDVMTALNEGSLKGKKIGTSWRITRAALEEFMKT